MILEVFILLFWIGIWTYGLNEFDKINNKSLWDRFISLPFTPWLFAWILMDFFQETKHKKLDLKND